MTGEEMEIITGNGHVDQAEDIDIDLNYTSGQMDDDMMLGDYDQVNDGQPPSPEEGDEQMAEGDDASYGMVDADEIDYTENDDPTNDHDIEIGGTDDNSWLPEPAAMVQDAGNAQTSVDEGDVWLEGQTSNVADVPSADAQPSTTSEARKDSPNTNVTISSNVGHAEVSKGSPSPAVLDDPPATEDGSAAPQEQETQQPGMHEEHQEEPDVEYEEERHDEYQEEHLEEYREDYDEGFGELDKVFGENGEDQDGQGTAASEVVDTNATDGGPEPLTDVHRHETGEPDDRDDVENAEATDEWPEEHLGISDEAQADVDSPEAASHTDKQVSSQNHAEVPVPQSSSPYAGSASAEDDNDGENKAVAPLPHPQITATEDPSAIAARYDIIVQYGDSDYQLFAKSTEDDPNGYFLSDRSTLDLPLAGFLSSIREVIAQELSPLDELVMGIDGLGVEFAETTTRDFIERYTFGDMLVLIDTLASNDDADFKPDIHIVLQVRPNCSQRLAALVDQANSGRGLSDVALYRDSPQLDDDDFSDGFGEYGEDEAPAITPEPENNEYHDDVDDGVNNNDQSDEQKTLELTENDDQDQHPDSQGVDGQSAGAAKSPVEDEAEVANPDDDVLNGNDDWDLGPAKQGNNPFLSPSPIVPCTGNRSKCFCDDCFLFNLSDDVDDNHQPGLPNPGEGRQSYLHGTPSAPAYAPQGEIHQQYTFSIPNISDANTNRSQDEPGSNETQDHPINHPDTPPTQNGHGSDASSHNTSVTATVNGDEQDEIDYSDDEGGDDQDAANSTVQDEVATQETTAPTKSQTAVEDEITWESDDEDAGNVADTTPSKPLARVSPTTGKRSRSASNAADDEAPPSAKPRLS
ncbi:hypothetical protein PG985_010217 [Apiospora marii]|uniref:uncharacterized protein n=1 Tax=Apiospora marii TaxID=335849 RepID=UPI00312F10C3